MKRKAFLYFGLLICLLTILAGCGKQEEESGYYEILTEKKQLPDARENVDTTELEEYVYLGSQYLQGEWIQIWGERKQEEEGNIYLHRENGDRELLLENVDGNLVYSFYKWWVDDNRQCYIISANKVIRPDMSGGLREKYVDGNVVYEGVIFSQKKEGANFQSICQLNNGHIVLLDAAGRYLRLWEADPDTGELTELQSFAAQDLGFASAISADPEGTGLVMLCSGGVWEIDLQSGKADRRLSFDGTTFILRGREKGIVEENFRMLEDGSAEVLWSDGTVETLKLSQIDTERERVVFRSDFVDSWIRERVAEFNQKNKNYYVTIEESEGSGSSDLEIFRQQTELEIGTGKGADIIESGAVRDARSLMEKGAFVDLTSFLEMSGLKEEDYFPGAFSGWRKDEAIYGIRCRAMLKQYCVDREVVGKDSIAGVEELVDCLLAYEGDAVFKKSAYYSSGYILRFFMQNSESLCGMVDFEQDTCDFSGELFEKMLEAAKRYGYEEKKKDFKSIMHYVDYYNFYSFCDNGFLLDMGLVPIGNMFDDGGHMDIYSNVLAINSNSHQKEGACEFLRYLLSEEVQSSFYVEDTEEFLYVHFPVDRNVFEKLCEKHLEVINDGEDFDLFNSIDYVHLTGLTEERKTALRTAMEDARPKLFDTEPLIQIILEEAGGFFSGARTIDQVRETVENRVQLYLNEN